MKKNKKTETLIFEGLGFPVRLINAPLRKVYGEWIFDFSMGSVILRYLIGTLLRFLVFPIGFVLILDMIKYS